MLVVSMIPIALGTGPGSAGRAAMAKVIIGGQMLCLLLTLLPLFLCSLVDGAHCSDSTLWIRIIHSSGPCFSGSQVNRSGRSASNW